MQNLANIITCLRILLSLSLIMTEPFSGIFFAIYILCGISDVLDGMVARAYSLISAQGKALDACADFIMFACVFFKIFPLIQFQFWIIYWVTGIFILRVFNIIFAALKFKAFFVISTYTLKLTGLILFFLPFSLLLSKDITYYSVSICIFASFAAIEEFLIILLQKKPNNTLKSVFCLIKAESC